MHSVLGYAASAVVCAVWQLPMLAVAGWIVTRLLRRVGPAVEHGVWVAVLVLSVALPLIPARHGDMRSVETQVPDAHVVSNVSVQIGQGFLHQAGLIRLPLLAVESLCGLWLLTVLVGCVRLLTGASRMKRLLADAERYVWTKETERVWLGCRALIPVGPVRVLSSRAITGPVAVSSALVLPSGFAAEVSVEELRAALLHELAHLRRHDFRNNLLYQLVALPVLFHPATWFVKQQLAATREMACDAAVVEATGDGIAYGNALLRLATWMGVRARAVPTHAIGIFDANVLEERIVRLCLQKSKLSRAMRVALIGVGACVIAIGVGSAMASSVEVTTQAKAPGTQGAKAPGVYVVGRDVTAPKLVYQVNPDFPEAARKAKIKGECIVAVVVDEHGVPRNVHIDKGVRADMDANAVAAVKQYRFTPGMHAGKPVPVQLSVMVNFQIF